MKRIHIIGSGPRTGTTLLEEAMKACFEIDNYVEHEARIFKDEPLEGNIFLTKYPADFYAVGFPLKLNKDLYVICIIRDPRDAVVSKHGSKPEVYWAGLRYWKLFMKYYKRLKNHPRFIVVKYEDLVTKPDDVQKYLEKKIPFLKRKAKFSEYHVVAMPDQKSLNALKGVRKILPKGIGTWKEHLPRIASQINIHGDITEDLIYFGYEKNNSWKDIISNVQPDNQESFWPEEFSKIDLMNRKVGELIEVRNILLRRIGINPTLLKNKIKRVIGK